MNNIPFLFFRFRTCNEENGLRPNTTQNRRMTAVVKLAKYWDTKHYDSSWMDDPKLSRAIDEDDYTMVPDVDIAEESFVFDSDDSSKNERDAIAKMKELWSKVGVENHNTGTDEEYRSVCSDALNTD